ncbi:MAG: hypothetical protein IJ448_05290 [Oscillospiraceae bacterium]|nr:hypothetical protein [Oscillospiraceae bacterium]
MIVESTLPARAYMHHMRSEMGSFAALGHERFTGLFLGRLFCVTYHSGYEWNRRISNQKNTALGYVCKNDDGCRVHYMHLKGLFSPPTFFLTGLLMTLALLAKFASDLTDLPSLWLIPALAFGATAIAAPIATLIESCTEKSREGAAILKAFLKDPSDPFSYLNHGGTQ